jgi:hypothetical protein
MICSKSKNKLEQNTQPVPTSLTRKIKFASLTPGKKEKGKGKYGEAVFNRNGLKILFRVTGYELCNKTPVARNPHHETI